MVKITPPDRSAFIFSSNKIKKPETILHCGAHLGKEYEHYKSFGAAEVYWVEALPHLCNELRRKFGEEIVFEGALDSFSRQIREFYVTDNILSSSLKKIGANEWDLEIESTILVETFTLHDIADSMSKEVDYLILDLQGNEFEALSLSDWRIQPKIVICEVSEIPFYENSHDFYDLLKLLESKDYKFIGRFTEGKHGHGEAIFLHAPKLNEILKVRLYWKFNNLKLRMLKSSPKVRKIVKLFLIMAGTKFGK
jgi:FkbM family methyltransferase